MIHHETISARRASEDSGSGNFDVIEFRRGEFSVWSDGLWYGDYPTLRAAIAAAKQEARDYDHDNRQPPRTPKPKLFPAELDP